MVRVQGIGGVFFRSRDPAALAAWYEQHLGIPPVPSDYCQPAWEPEPGATVFAPFPEDSGYFGRAEQSFMLNFRVKNLDAVVEELESEGIPVAVDREIYPNGRFARIHDPDGNPVELWEPR